MRRERSRPRLPLKILTRGGGGELTRISIDTTVGMIFSNVIAYFIILATRARCMRMASQAFLLFALGIIGTGLLALPVPAGSLAPM